MSLAAFFVTADVQAQEAEGSTQIYDRAYFERYDTVTAEDMVRRVPTPFASGPVRRRNAALEPAGMHSRRPADVKAPSRADRINA